MPGNNGTIEVLRKSNQGISETNGIADESIEMSKAEVQALLDFSLQKISFRELLNTSRDSFKAYILEYTQTNMPFTQGQEGEVFKLQGKNKEYIIAKKRFDNKSKNESEMQKLFHSLSKQSKSGVQVPHVLDEFTNGKNGYIVMEYVPGKTLYNLSWTQIAETHLIPLLIKGGNHKLYQSRFNDFLNTYTSTDKISFDSDAEAEEGIQELLEIMHTQGLVNNPNTIEKLENGTTISPIINDIYKKYIDDINIFSSEQGESINTALKTFLSEAHEVGLYHRDLGGNPRNIMFELGDNEEYKTWVIDFGMSINKASGNGENEDIDEGTGGRYDSDKNVIEKIKSFSGNQEPKGNTSIESQLNLHEKVVNAGKKHGLSIEGIDITNAIGTLKNINITSVFDDFLKGRDRSYNWFIYLKENQNHLEKTSTQRGKKKFFIMIQLMNSEQIKQMKNIVVQGLQKRKNSKEYKYAELFNQYLEDIENK